MSQVNWIRQFILALGLFLLGSAVYWFEFRYTPQQDEKKEQAKKVWVLPAGEIQSLTLMTNQQKLVFQCSQASASGEPQGCKQWKLVEPLVSDVDVARMAELWSALEQLKSTQVLDLKESVGGLSSYGLDEPSRLKASQVSVQTVQGLITLYLGLKHPLSPSLFVAVDHSGVGAPAASWDQVYVVPQGIEAHWSHDLTYWRNKKVFPEGLKPQQIQALQVLEGVHGSPWKAVQKEGKWSLMDAANKKTAADPQLVENWIRSLEGLSLDAFISETKSLALLRGFQKKFSLSMETLQSTRHTLDLYVKAGKKSPAQSKPSDVEHSEEVVYGVTSERESLFRLPTHLLAQVNISLESLRNKIVLRPDERFSVQKIIFAGKAYSPSLVLSQDQGVWKAEGKEIVVSKVTSFLESLSQARVQAFISAQQPHVAPPSGLIHDFQLTLQNSAGGVIRSYQVWEKDGKLYGKDQSSVFSESQETFVLEKITGGQIPWQPAFFAPPPDTKDSSTPVPSSEKP